MTAPDVVPPLQAWPANWGERRPGRNVGMLWVGIALFAIAAAMVSFSGGDAGPLWSGAVLALFGLTALVVTARRPFGRGRMRLVDTARLTGGGTSTTDVRVHFVPERLAGAATLLLSAVWAIVLTAATVVAVQMGAAGRPQAFLGAAVLGLFAALFAYAATRGAVARYRFDAFGRRPVGLAIGSDGVFLVRVGETLHVPWVAIRRVEAEVTELRRGVDRTPLIRLRLDPERAIGAGGTQAAATVTVAAAMLQMHPHVAWSALHGFHRSPSSRAILGTPSGQLLLDEWCASAPTG